MKRIALTQRVITVDEYSERRDALDQRWINFVLSVGMLPVLIPNNINYIKCLVNEERVDGVLFTGGESLAKYGGDVPERDEVELYLLDWAIKLNIPVLGVCRGMQVIQDYFNNDLIKVNNHVAVRHKLLVEKNCRLSELLTKYEDVNSFHDYGSLNINSSLKKTASSSDGVVMAIEHQEKNLFGVMWHMEREPSFCEADKSLFKFIFS